MGNKRKRRNKVEEEPEAKKVNLENVYAGEPMAVKDVSDFINNLLTEEAPIAWKDFLHKDTPQNDILAEYLSLGGQTINLIRGFSKISSYEEISTFFTLCRAILLSIAGSEDPKTCFNGKGFEFGVELCHALINDYHKDIINLLSMSNPPEQVKSSLNVLTAMVTLGPEVSKMVISKLDWDHEDWMKLPFMRKQTDSEETSIRTSYIHFLLSFLIEPSQYVRKEYFENKKTRLASIFGDLMYDSYEVVMLVLATLRTKVVENIAVSKTFKLKLFYSNNIINLLELTKWTGEKNKKAEILDSLYSMLKILLTSTKYGVAFQDPFYASNGKSANILLTDLLEKIVIDPDSELLTIITTDILVNNPGELPAYLNKTKLRLQPRGSPGWYQLADMYYAIFKEMSVEKILASQKKEKKVTLHILTNILFSQTLLDNLVLPGLKQDSCKIFLHCMKLLEVMVQRAQEFSDGTTLDLVPAEFKRLCTAKLPDLELLMNIWQIAVTAGDPKTMNATLSVIKLRNKYFGLEDESVFVRMLKDLKHLKIVDDDVEDPRIKLLSIVASSLDENQNSEAFVTSFLSKKILTVLLNCLISDSQEKRKVGKTVLTSIMLSTQACLKDVLDLDIFMDLIANESLIPVMTEILWTSIQNVKSLEQEIIGYNNIGISNETVDDLLNALMKSQPLPKNFNQDSASITISPLILSILDNGSQLQDDNILQKFLDCFYVTLSNREDIVKIATERCESLSDKDMDVSEDSESLSDKDMDVSEDSESLAWLTPEVALQSTGFTKVYASKLTMLKDNDGLSSFLAQVSNESEQKLVVQHLFKKDLIDTFDLFSKKPNVLTVVLPFVNKFNISSEHFSSTVISQAVSAIENKEIKKFNLQQVLDTFEWTDIKEDDVVMILKKLSEQGVNKLLSDDGKLNQRGALLVACIKSLTKPTYTTQDKSELFSQLSSHIEFILEKSSDDHLIEELNNLMKEHSDLADHLAVNIVYVLASKLSKDSSKNLVVQLVKSSNKMSDACLEWLGKVKSETVSNFDVISLANILVSSGCLDKIISYKKAVKNLIKKSVSCVTDDIEKLSTGGEDAGFAATDAAINLIKSISSDISSSKCISIVQTFFSENKEKLKKMVTDSSLSFTKRKAAIEFTYHVLTILGDNEKDIKKHFLNYILIPIIQALPSAWSSDQTPPQKCDITGLCDIGQKTAKGQSHSAVTNYLKKNKDLWSTFIKCILRHGLKDEEFGVQGIGLLSTLCSLRYKTSVSSDENYSEEDIEEMNLVVDMIVSHSAYLNILFGSKSLLKVSMIELLISLAPASCRQDQVDTLFAGYTGTLHPSDTAILRLLCTMESHAIAINIKHPFLFGHQALHQLNQAAGSTATQFNSFEDCIGIIKPDMVRKIADNFPLNMPFNPLEEYEISEELYSLYDPRFVLSYISSLTGRDILIERTYKLIDSDVMSLAFMALGSYDYEMRTMGYHALFRIYKVLEDTGKGYTKHIWMHLIELLRNGLAQAGQDREQIRIPCITTLFMAKSCNIINQSTSMFPKITSVLVAKPVLDLFRVPGLMGLLHSDDVNTKQHQMWILTLIRDGLQSELDHRMLEKLQVYKLVLSSATSDLVDKSLLIITLEILDMATRITEGSFGLCGNLGLLPWLNLILPSLDEEKEFELLMNIYSNIKKVLEEESQRKDASNKDVDVEEGAKEFAKERKGKIWKLRNILECNIQQFKTKLTKVNVNNSNLNAQLKMLCI